MADDKTIFAMIIDGDIPSEKLYEDDHAIVIKDINPQAPTHVLIIPKATDIPRLVDADESHQALLGHLLLVAGKVAKQLGVDDAFRLIINNGADAGQTVFHLHLHIIANKKFDETSLGKEFD
jgi:histidine triad (HIT) family protein